MKPFWETQEPDFVNELGVKWYVDKDVTRYCFLENLSGISLDDVLAYVTVLPSGETDRVLVQRDRVIYAGKSLESIGFEIDKLKLLQSHDKNK